MIFGVFGITFFVEMKRYLLGLALAVLALVLVFWKGLALVH